ncbi:hypothetical protein EHS25_004773 [Saitozyma podzolica]|uniref:Aminotransferase class V domain-containing protein n=1 Tax=Saitozyma podzolica TaxID=1890683 RepID=A0A427Y2R9_9TREE|nr:hypothetical protein EHS25_004773 [Saitozyma podzolica]
MRLNPKISAVINRLSVPNASSWTTDQTAHAKASEPLEESKDEISASPILDSPPVHWQDDTQGVSAVQGNLEKTIRNNRRLRLAFCLSTASLSSQTRLWQASLELSKIVREGSWANSDDSEDRSVTGTSYTPTTRDDDVVITCGSGSTAAVNRVIDVLGLRLNTSWEGGVHLRARVQGGADRPVVFIGPYEHPSNELPWIEYLADVIPIKADSQGHIDQVDLGEKLAAFADRPLRIGSFSAASNVTGIISDVDGITGVLHQAGALAFWDYAAAAPYLKIDMNPDRNDPPGLRNKDAVFISPHKFVGGPGTPGLLVAKRHLFTRSIPTNPGGGTVSFVTPHSHRYSADLVEREESGTPAIIESIPAGLVFQLKERVGSANIERLEADLVKRALERWRKNPKIRILGNTHVPRLSIIIFVITHAYRTLHHNFVVALLNDPFGGQASGGCSCAGPYGHQLLGIDDATGVKPGWVRLGFNYFISEATFRFILDAVDFVAEYGPAFLALYHFDVGSGIWSNRSGRKSITLRLHDIQYGRDDTGPGGWHSKLTEAMMRRYLDEARRLALAMG